MSRLKLSDVNSQYGAPMGRRNLDLEGKVGDVKMYLEVVPLDSGGYDRGGAYWGLRMPINYVRADGAVVRVTPRIYRYYVTTNGRHGPLKVLIEGFIDAIDRADAKKQIREQYPEARFYA